MFLASTERQALLHEALDELTSKDSNYATCAFFTSDEVAQMIEDTKNLSFRQATPVVGKGVHQDMEVCFPAPRIGAFADCADLLEGATKSWQGFAEYLLPEFQLNDFAVQKYPAGSAGIGIHKDGLRYKNLVFIITLSGQSRLFYTDKREGGTRIKIDDSPGHLVVLKAPGFGDDESDTRLLHGVDEVTGGRLSIGFRYEVGA